MHTIDAPRIAVGVCARGFGGMLAAAERDLFARAAGRGGAPRRRGLALV